MFLDNFLTLAKLQVIFYWRGKNIKESYVGFILITES